MDTHMDRYEHSHIDEDSRLMQKLMKGNLDAFNRLFDKYGSVLEHILANYANHNILPEDFIQEVFTRLWEKRMNFRGQSRFFTYLYGIAKHTLSEEMRQPRNITTRDLHENIASERHSYDDLSQPEIELSLKELKAVIDDVKGRLTIKERQALEISYVDDIPIYQASKMLGCSHEAFKSRLKRARKRAREIINPALLNK